ncbi:hypothetical protein HDG34_005863 [Paraburkholderia sp. HC6.4b]|uniref:hypothetical protein n=1 Tax=unclassified Paraburkholderia TaxID=2615204 RepID=UPI001611DA2E|nr:MULTISPECIES: hypothetical protein [unclassified Paraburkholderia]MBB5411897.1 hypothetical protein [Paraburkholderia sp. HC6.4b]MBB5450209.1 hypothetical protein [Paraburkholderia sp. Kb1A]
MHDFQVAKFDAKLGLVFGWANICTKAGAPYYDSDNECIPESVALEAWSSFMQGNRTLKLMHAGDEQGEVVFAFPLTSDIASSLGITAEQSGVVVGVKPNSAMLGKFASGELKGFSIGGSANWVDD